MAASNVIANLKIMLSASWQGLRRDFGKASATVKGFRNNIEGTSSKLGAVMGKLGTMGAMAGVSAGGIGSLAKAFTSLGMAGGLALAGLGGLVGIGAVSVWGTKLAAQAEQVEVAFTTMLGSAEQAKALMGKLRDFAASTPFQQDELVQAARQLSAFGVQAGDVIPTMRMLGDISAGIGAPITEIAELFGKAKVQGRLFMEDINQFQGRGIPILQALADTMGVAVEKVRDMVSNGKVGFFELQGAFQNLTGEGSKFGGMMEKQSNTLIGMWSTIKDQFSQMALEWGEVLLPAVKTAVSWIRDLSTFLLSAVKALKELAGYTVPDIELPKEDFSAMRGGVQEIADVMTDASKKMKDDFVDVAKLSADVNRMNFTSSVGAFDRRSTAGFSAVEAAKRESRDRERRNQELAKRVLDRIDELIRINRENAIQVNRRKV